jgi:hypothetical protein
VSRVYGDPVEVWTSDDGRPTRFVWRGRLHTVLQVLEHWVTTRDWLRESDEETRREFWRVEATPDDTTAVYELRHDAATDTWMLSRAWL